MTSLATYISLAVAAVAAIDDVMTRKVHNVVLAVLAVASLSLIARFYGVPGVQNAVLGFLAGAALYFPLAWMGVVGGGDLKLLAVLGLSSGPWATLVIGVFALVWASILGILQLVFKGQLKAFGENLVSLAKMKKPKEQALHKVPFAAGVLLATLSQWILGGRLPGGFL